MQHKCDIDAIVRAEWARECVFVFNEPGYASKPLRCPECGATITYEFTGTITSRDDRTGRRTTTRVKPKPGGEGV